jgi:hypothetical protein
MDLLRYRQQVARGLNAVEASLALLVNALAHSAVSIEAEPTADEESPIRRVCEAYSTINYRMDDEVGLSVVCLGVIGANAEILRLAEAVNRAKANFIVVCAPLQDIFTRIPVKDETSPTRSVPLIRVILRNLQRSDLNLLAAYRNIPILGAPPASVTYTRANTRAVYRKSLEEIDELLQNREGPAATADRQRLETLDRRETHLALVKARYQNIRANVLYARLDTRGRGRIQISAELPLLYAKNRRVVSPEVRFPASGDPANPSRARQPRLEPVPFMHSIPVYRYARLVDQ